MNKSNRQQRTSYSPRIQVNESLAALISRRKPGEQLPPEPQLAQQLGVSRATLREAMRSFEEHGQIVRRHGVGTFVAPPPPLIETGLEELESLDTLARRIGLEIHMCDAVIEEREATPNEAAHLQVPPGSSVISVARVMTTGLQPGAKPGTQPVAYLVDIVPATYLRRQDLGETFNGSVLDLLIERDEPALSHSRTDIMAEAAQGALARQLHLQRGQVLLKLEAQLVAQDGQIVDYSLSYFVPGYMHFHVVRRIGKSEANNKSQRVK
jgi:GntR family transcriptional regulator